MAIPDDVERDDAAMAEEHRRAEKVFKQADADRDAALDKTEAQQFMELYEEMMKQRAEDDEGAETEQGDSGVVLAEDLHGEEGDDFGKDGEGDEFDVMDLDANNDGKLTFEEFWAIPDDVERDDAAMAEERRRAEKVFKQADAS